MKVYQVKEASIGCHFSYIIDDSNKGKKVMTKESTIILHVILYQHFRHH